MNQFPFFSYIDLDCIQIIISSVQLSLSVVSNSLWPHGLQHARFPCPSPTPRVYSNSCPSHRWCHPTISSSVVPFSSRLQSFPASGSFPVRWFFTSVGQSIRVSASASVLQMKIQDWFPLGWTGGSPCCPRDSQESSLTPQFKSINSSALSCLYSSTLTSIHPYMTTGASLHHYTALLIVISTFMNKQSTTSVPWKVST